MNDAAHQTRTRPADPVALLRAGLDPEPGTVHPELAALLGVDSAAVADPAVAALLDIRGRGVAHGTPASLVAALDRPGSAAVRAATASAVFDAFGRATARHGRAEATAAVRAGLLLGGPTAGPLLDLAGAHGLAPLSAGEALAVAGHRHAAWRYLSGLGADGARALAAEPEPEPGYPALLLAAARRRAGLAAAHPLLSAAPMAPAPGPVLAQSMLLGDLDLPGEGASGGVSVLLSALGDALADRPDIGRVLTVVLASTGQLPGLSALLTPADPAGRLGHPPVEHWIVRVPVEHPTPLPQPLMAGHRAAITWWVGALLAAAGQPVDVVHVRYADDGSLAVADAAADLGAALVFTATADPHRVLAERYPPGAPLDRDALHFDLHRVAVADRLVERAARVVVMPARPGDDEFARFFPALDPARLATVEEGITPHRPRSEDEAVQEQLVAGLFAAHPVLPRLTGSARGLPVLLNVGRLHPVKQQDVLVESWLRAGLHRRSALVVVGGSAAAPTADERAIQARITALLADVPEAVGRLAVVPALSNRAVRLLEHALARLLPSPTPHLYVCSSVKEEFGIAVLEAMDAGLLVAGPVRGGLGNYLEPGRNGYLVDTATAGALGRAVADVLDSAAADPVAARRIAAAGRDTVRRRFGITGVAAKFAAVYRTLR